MKDGKPENIKLDLLFECPSCGAKAYVLWKIYGCSYFKCECCGYKSKNLKTK